MTLEHIQLNWLPKVSDKPDKSLDRVALVPELPPANHHNVADAAVRSTDDIGNGERVRDLYGDHVRHLGDEEEWAIWDGRRWALDKSRLSQEIAKGVAESMRGEQVHYLRGANAEQPAYPEGYPAIDPKGNPIAPDQWMEDNADAALDWLYDARERVQWLKDWMTWANSSQDAKRLRAFADTCRNMGRLKSMMDAARSLAGISALRGEFDNKSVGIFNTPNGTLEVRTLKFREHRPSDMNTRVCPVDYQPAAPAPKWRAFLESNLPDPKTRKYLQKLIGYALTGESDQKIIVFLFSKVGDTGKSLVLGVCEALFGPEYAMSLAQSALAPRKDGGDGGRDPDRHAIMGRRFVIASEFKAKEPMDEAFVKRLTGGDAISTRGNFSKGNTSWLPELVPVIATNHLSRISGEDEAIWNRIVVIPFTKSFPVGHPERDEGLKDAIIRDEMPGVLAWAVEGLELYRKEGLVPSPEITLASAAYRTDTDNVSTWLAHAVDDGLIKLDDGPGATLAELLAVFHAWAKSEGIAGAPGRNNFKDRLLELGYEYKPRGVDPGRSVRVMHGIHLCSVLSQSVSRS